MKKTIKKMIDQGNGRCYYASDDNWLFAMPELVGQYKAFRQTADSSKKINRIHSACYIYDTALMLGHSHELSQQAFTDYGGYKYEEDVTYRATEDDSIKCLDSFAAYFLTGSEDVDGNRLLEPERAEGTKVYFEPDEDMNTGDAIRCIYRLSRTERAAYEEMNQIKPLVPDGEFQSYLDDNTFPEVTSDGIPYHAGIVDPTMDSATCVAEDGGWSRRLFCEDTVRLYKEMGFQSIRIQVHYLNLTSTYDENLISMEMLENVDDIVKWCAKYDMHLMFDLIREPGMGPSGAGIGGVRDLAKDEAKQQYYIDFMKMITTRYKNIPANTFSISLIQEPLSYFDVQDSK